MASASRRPFKFQEFAAHSGDVRCVSIGRKSCQVLATGGDDRKVNVWALGKPNALMSLSGHTSPVECVAFDSQEEVIVAGATSGTIKLWDLDQAKAIRTLVGHRSDCMSVDFHPYGAFFASGSLDTNLKVWDIRRKACIQTYKGHTQGITCIRFSPDGKWVVSGGEDGMVKLWDLTAGKMLFEYQHDGAVTSLDLHPSELLLASGGMDRAVRLVDLEELKVLGTTPSEGSGAGVSRTMFSDDGRGVLSVSGDYIKVWSHEPQVELLDTIEAGWGQLGDMWQNASRQTVACSLHSSFVQVWVLNLSSMRPWASLPVAAAAASVAGEVGGGLNQPAARPVALGGGVGHVRNEGAERGEKQTRFEEGEAQKKAFCAAQNRAKEERIAAEVASTYAAQKAAIDMERERLERAAAAAAAVVASVPLSEAAAESVSRDKGNDWSSLPSHDSTPSVFDKENLASTMGTDVAAVMRYAPSQQQQQQQQQSVDVSTEPARAGGRLEGNYQTKALQERLSSLQQMWGGMQEDRQRAAARRPPSKGRGWASHLSQPPVSLDSGQGTDVQRLVVGDEDNEWFEEEEEETVGDGVGGTGLRPPQGVTSQQAPEQPRRTTPPPTPQPDEVQVLDSILEDSAGVRDELRRRLEHVRDCLRVWQKGDTQTALQAAVWCKDDGAVCDVLSCVSKMPQFLTLDSFVLLLPRLVSLLESHNEDHTVASMHTIQVLVRTFSDFIRHTRIGPLPPGVDITAEERRRKCDHVLSGLESCCGAGGNLGNLKRRTGRVGALARGVIAAVEAMR